jgi:GNAT superfamily N-acetyltransferase
MSDTFQPRWCVEPFDSGRHVRTGFDCGVPVLDEWLLSRAGQYERRDLARVYVLVSPGDPTVRGYYALSSHAVTFDALPSDQAKGLPRINVPAVLIGRLAVNKSMQGQGLGEFLLIDALRRAEYLSDKVGVRAVEVHALDDTARRFYERYGFLSLLDDPQHLFLPLHVIRQLKLPPLEE